MSRKRKPNSIITTTEKTNDFNKSPIQLTLEEIISIVSTLEPSADGYFNRNCLICQSNVKDVTKHLLESHTLQPAFSCNICSVKFKEKLHLDLHKINHVKKDNFKCFYCSTQFSKEILRKIHEIQKHNEINYLYRCNFCKRKFQKSNSFYKHLLVHAEQLNLEYSMYSCQKCEEFFFTTERLEQHKKLCIHQKEDINDDLQIGNETEDSFQTSDGNSNYLSSEELNNFSSTPNNKASKKNNVKNSVSESNELKKYIYQELDNEMENGEQIKSRNNLKYASRTKEKFFCNLCPKVEYYRWSFTRHMKIHEENKKKDFLGPLIVTINSEQSKSEEFSLSNGEIEYLLDEEQEIEENNPFENGDIIKNQIDHFYDDVISDTNEVSKNSNQILLQSYEDTNTSLKDQFENEETEIEYLLDETDEEITKADKLDSNQKIPKKMSDLDSDDGETPTFEFFDEIDDKKLKKNSNLTQKHINELKIMDKSRSKRTLNKKFSCPVCYKKFRTRYIVNQHLNIHSSQKTFLYIQKPFICNVCKQKFNFRSGLQRHLKLMHAGVHNFFCSLCEETFAMEFQLKRHIKCWHNNPGKMKTYEERKYLNATMLKKNDGMYHCVFCEKIYARAPSIRSHIKIHTRPKQCTLCQKPFSSYSSLKRHIVNVHNIEFMKTDKMSPKVILEFVKVIPN